MRSLSRRKIIFAISRAGEQFFPATSSLKPIPRHITNITYSGGQASEGQGGYYGSGGARATAVSGTSATKACALALEDDVRFLSKTIAELERLEHLYERETDAGDGEEKSPSGKSIEIRAAIKKLMTQESVVECLRRLEFDGKPVWGLSVAEREMVLNAQQKVNEC
uniref:Uncharacterized protein n=1 Tax=Corethron hystrix TaxID=216773 RepID=A0A7S1BRK7_9STRA|mmetsp:Transcript_37215/g.86815  ORF Transcript_37215/g.86815 Transcript_37215/m.86815 type:complete len:166 (+) Transcript_37215:130-627(+)|eukprot:CAMPEP_0113306390 /NCGR_PEP_ID=MMETSP0010_2-20120614/5656_1 /TAXON_ID=216773 ORGANISM="Corethron hystrix, Strain 308" /NCGR_SAMPLE_ID=MMETSP0010_2 /ASSEMBLY_ACC=CAM_ASM_000155 /LENGTH=165 /DNA_ID=CAMNT_0000161039 /DNA_START=65 /DNA_END=562 /DNA_ORIENTATION=+ /assembly_acc=CAM_ASM_000155